jgi:hypothetical protein
VNYYQKLCFHCLGLQAEDRLIYERPTKGVGFGGVTEDGQYY